MRLDYHILTPRKGLYMGIFHVGVLMHDSYKTVHSTRKDKSYSYNFTSVGSPRPFPLSCITSTEGR